MTASAVVFDIGNVLVNWDPHLVWLEELGSVDAVAAFLDRVDFSARNLRCDQGETFASVASELPDADDARRLARYPSLFHLSVAAEVPGTWAIVDQLLARDIPLHAITNWSAETWPEGLKAHPSLGTIFGTTIVSGAVGQIKPEIEVYKTFFDQAKLAPEDCVFIDDKRQNVDGAKAAGMDAIHFTGADVLALELTERGFL